MAVDPKRVQSLFLAAAREADVAARAALLDREAGADPELRRRVEALLRAHDEPGGALESPLVPTADSGLLPSSNLLTQVLHKPTTPIAAGTMIAGRYRLLETIGEGGMGTVWMAEQREPIKRRVALKLIKPGMDSRNVLARFEAERQALAMMDHPNIARVLDGGTTEHGLPFFVMELVKGIPLMRYCDERRLSIRDRLGLFVPICQAVQHAHQKGIIHRDLKPTNVLVTEMDGRPVPKVIDFGLAKALQGAQTLTDHTLYTAFGAKVRTPLNMPPQQLGNNALDVDTRTDIYSLGVMLYELLTGTTPLESNRLKQAAWDEVRRIIREEDPPKPSTRLSTTDALPAIAASRQTDAAKLGKLVRGDLDWIVLKAIDKERARRYETANGLARDIERFLTDEPVEACPPSAAYRFRKLVRRHRGGFVAGTLIGAALLLGVIGTSVGLVRAERHRRNEVAARVLAQSRFNDVRALANKFMLDFHDKIENLPGSTPAVKMLVETSRDYLNRLADEVKDDPELQRDLIIAYRKIGDIQSTIGEPTAALESYRRGFTLTERMSVGAPDNLDIQNDLRRLHHRIGNALTATGDRDAAQEHYRAGLEIARRVAATNPGDVEAQLAVGTLQQSLGGLENYRAAREAFLNVVRQHPDDADAQRAIARLDRTTAGVLIKQGDLGGSLNSYYQAMIAYQKLADADPANYNAQLDLAITQMAVGNVLLFRLNDLEGAASVFAKARQIIEPLAESDRLNAKLQQNLAQIYESIGLVRDDLGDDPGALSAYRKFQEISQRLVDLDTTNTDAWRLLQTSFWRIGWILHDLGDADGEVAAFRRLEDVALNRNDNIWLAESQRGLGAAFERSGDLSSALESREKSVEAFRRAGDVEPDNGVIHERLGEQIFRLGQLRMTLAQDTARSAAARAEDLGRARVALHEAQAQFQRMKERGILAPDYAHWWNDVSNELTRCNDLEHALAAAATMPAIQAAAPTTAPATTSRRIRPEAMEAMNQEATHLAQDNKFSEALALREQIVDAAAKQFSADDLRIARYRLSLADLLVRAGRFVDAEAQLMAARLVAQRKQDRELSRVALSALQGLYQEWSSRESEEQPVATGNAAAVIRTLDAESQVAEHLLKENRREEAASLWQHIVDTGRRSLPAGEITVARHELRLADLLVEMQRYTHAEENLLDAVKRGEASNDSWIRARALRRLGSLYQAWNKPEKAEEYRRMSQVAAASTPVTQPAFALTSQPATRPALIDAGDTAALLAAVGQEVMVEGTIRSMVWGPTGKAMFIAFEGTDASGFFGVVFREFQQRLDDRFGGDMASNLTGAGIWLRGRVVLYQDRPEIQLSEPDQIEVIRPAAARPPSDILLSASDTAGLLAAMGRERTVEGRVQSTSWTPDDKVLIVAFEGTGPAGFIGAIFKPRVEQMNERFNGNIAAALTGAVVQFRGRIAEYNSRPEIILNDADQIEILRPASAPTP